MGLRQFCLGKKELDSTSFMNCSKIGHSYIIYEALTYLPVLQKYLHLPSLRKMNFGVSQTL